MTSEDQLSILKSKQKQLRTLMYRAGEAVMQIYNSSSAIDVQTKADNSPLTAADLASHDILTQGLKDLTPKWPILSEESVNINHKTRQQWSVFWLIDPLDGTKEFLHRSNEFTVNLALIVNGLALAGWVYAPAIDELYEALQSRPTLTKDGNTQLIQTRTLNPCPKLLVSRRHANTQTQKALQSFETLYGRCEHTTRGSSLKICELAAGRADFYPRIGPTHEWDTAAAHAVLKAAGGDVFDLAGDPLVYNQKADTLNPFFLACADLSDERLPKLVTRLKALED